MMKQYKAELEEKENQLLEINKQFNTFTKENLIKEELEKLGLI